MTQSKGRKISSMIAVAIFCTAMLFSVTVFSAPQESFRTGFESGRINAAAVRDNITALEKMADENQVDMAAVTVQAYVNEKIYQQVLPDKVEWMKGVAEGAGVSYEKILLLNSMDRAITGFQGECTTFMAQGKALASGKGTIISKNRDQAANCLSEISVNEHARHGEGELYKAAYIDIPQAEETYKFIGSRTAGRWGYGMGVNEFQVIVGDNDANTRDTLEFKKGLHDNDVIRLILERAKTAREGVSVVAGLVEKYGQAWNGIMFEIGDPNELWIVEVTGHRWVAKRYVDTVTARSNQYQIGDDYDLSSDDLVSFAVKNGWADKKATRINFRGVYGTWELYPDSNDNFAQRPAAEKLYNTEMRYQRAMELLNKAKGNITPEAIMPMMRDHYDTYTLPSGKVLNMNQVPFYSSEAADWYNREWMVHWPQKDTIETSMYIRGVCGHDLGWGATSSTAIMLARPDVPNELGLMLHSFMEPCCSTFVPFYVGMDKADERYTSTKAAHAFHGISLRAFGYYRLYHDGIRAAFAPHEESLFRDMPAFEEQYQLLKNSGKSKEAEILMQAFTGAQCENALQAVKIALSNMEQADIQDHQWKQR